MRRSMKLIRKLLEYAESHATGERLSPPELDEYSGKQISYHVKLCEEAGYMRIADGYMAQNDRDKYDIIDLTWQGHEALEKMRTTKTLE